MFAFIILIIVNAIILIQTGVKASIANDKKDWTIYGTMGCGWTRKQIDYMKKNGKSHTFVDCEKSDCAGVDAFPTLEGPNGEKIVGYKEI